MLVPGLRMIAMILFVMFAIALLVISSLVLRNVMVKTVVTAMINVKPPIIVVKQLRTISIRPVIV
jgi:hypothetical protein